MATANGPDDDQTVKEVEAYMKKYNIQQVLKDSIVQLCIQKPESPFGFLKDYFAKLEKVQLGHQNKLRVYDFLVYAFTG